MSRWLFVMFSPGSAETYVDCCEGESDISATVRVKTSVVSVTDADIVTAQLAYAKHVGVSLSGRTIGTIANAECNLRTAAANGNVAGNVDSVQLCILFLLEQHVSRVP